MKKVALIIFFVCIFANFINAQSYLQYTGDVEIIDMDEDGSSVRFKVVASTDKNNESHLKMVAERTVLCELLFTGIEGVNNNEKLVQRENIEFFENFFDGKRNRYPYLRFVKGIQQAGTPKKMKNNEYQFVYYVEIKYKALVNEMKLHKLSDANAEIIMPKISKETKFN